jgi:uncharacterized MAPEG superfamily protein
MGNELGILGLYGLLVLVSILAQVLAGQMQVGLVPLIGNREPPLNLKGFAGRTERMQMNSAVAMALFAPAILILAAKGGFSSTSLLAAQIFLLARLVYAVVYALGLPWVRTTAWVIGFLATAWLYVLGLGVAVPAAA